MIEIALMCSNIIMTGGVLYKLAKMEFEISDFKKRVEKLELKNA